MIAIIRHGDRTPKQKMKMVVTNKRFLKLYDELNVSKTGRVKIKDPKLMQVGMEEGKEGEGGMDEGKEGEGGMEEGKEGEGGMERGDETTHP